MKEWRAKEEVAQSLRCCDVELGHDSVGPQLKSCKFGSFLKEPRGSGVCVCERVCVWSSTHLCCKGIGRECEGLTVPPCLFSQMFSMRNN